MIIYKNIQRKRIDIIKIKKLPSLIRWDHSPACLSTGWTPLIRSMDPSMPCASEQFMPTPTLRSPPYRRPDPPKSSWSAPWTPPCSFSLSSNSRTLSKILLINTITSVSEWISPMPRTPSHSPTIQSPIPRPLSVYRKMHPLSCLPPLWQSIHCQNKTGTESATRKRISFLACKFLKFCPVAVQYILWFSTSSGLFGITQKLQSTILFFSNSKHA